MRIGVCNRDGSDIMWFTDEVLNKEVLKGKERSAHLGHELFLKYGAIFWEDFYNRKAYGVTIDFSTAAVVVDRFGQIDTLHNLAEFKELCDNSPYMTIGEYTLKPSFNSLRVTITV